MPPFHFGLPLVSTEKLGSKHDKDPMIQVNKQSAAFSTGNVIRELSHVTHLLSPAEVEQ
jgi:hypothetical protein